MKKCVVKDCGSTDSVPSVLFHPQLWLSRIKLARKPSKRAVVCGLHFKPEDYDEQNQLRYNAVPQEAVCCNSASQMSSSENISNNIAVDSSLKERLEGIKVDIKIEEADESTDLEACRACLAVDCKMFALTNKTLKQAYTQVTGILVSPHDGLPQFLCWECASRVLSSAKHRARAKKADALLTALLSKGSLNMKDIRSINRHQTKLMSPLYHEYFKQNNCTMNIDNLTELNESVGFDNTERMYENENTEQTDDAGDEFEHFDDRDSSGIDEDDRIKSDTTNVQAEIDDKNIVKIVTKERNEIVETKLNTTNLKQEGKKIRQRKPKPSSNINRSRGKDGTMKSLQEFFTISNIKLEEEIASVENRKHSEAYIKAPFKCEICYRPYINKESCNAHALKHTEKFGDIECPVCKFRYRTKQALWGHVNANHRHRFRCKQCDFVTNTRTTADNHHTFHVGAIFKCPHCPKQFNKKTTYYSHLRVKHVCSFPCELCGHTFLSALGMAMHKRRRHILQNTTLQGPHCDACDITFANRDAYDTHLRMSSRHNSDNKRAIVNAYQSTPREFDADGNPRRARGTSRAVTCEQCGVTLDNMYAYAHHFRNKHPTETRTQHAAQQRGAPVVCELCGKKFHCMAALKSHMPAHTGVRGFKCGDCGKSFLGKMNLDMHQKLHQPRPIFQCEICQKQFSNSGNLKRHVLTHTNATPFECEACGKRVTTRVGLQSHIDHVHSGLPWPKRRRQRHRLDTKLDPAIASSTERFSYK